MNRIALVLGVLTIVLLDVILAFGNVSMRGAAFNAAIEGLPFVMIPSSVLFAYTFFSTGHRWLATLFLLNIGAFLFALGILAFGGRLSAPVLFVTDVLQLNLYVVALAKHWSLLLERTSAHRLMAEV
jgi:hypothetical protein